MKDFVQITSSVQCAIEVTAGLLNIDSTNLRSPTKDRLSVSPAWTRTMVKIMPGVGLYPSEIKNWEDVKAYVKSKKFSAPIETDGEGFDEETIAKAKVEKERLQKAFKKFEDDKKRAEAIRNADRKINKVDDEAE